MNPEKSKLQKKETTKNTPETTLMFVVVRDNLKLIPIKFIRAIERNRKLPILKIILFSLSLKL